MNSSTSSVNRCFGAGKDFYEHYHDHEWGRPVHDDRHLFELLCLEGAQAGLSWETILKRRPAYREAFYHFDMVKLAQVSDDWLLQQRQNASIIRNRLKIESVRHNARICLNLVDEFGSLGAYFWNYVDGQPIINAWQTSAQVPATTPLSDKMAKDLQKRGMKFVGSTIIYAHMQSMGLVWDHSLDCHCYADHLLLS